MRKILIAVVTALVLAVGAPALAGTSTDTYHDVMGAVTDTYHDV